MGRGIATGNGGGAAEGAGGAEADPAKRVDGGGGAGPGGAGRRGGGVEARGAGRGARAAAGLGAREGPVERRAADSSSSSGGATSLANDGSASSKAGSGAGGPPGGGSGGGGGGGGGGGVRNMLPLGGGSSPRRRALVDVATPRRCVANLAQMLARGDRRSWAPDDWPSGQWVAAGPHRVPASQISRRCAGARLEVLSTDRSPGVVRSVDATEPGATHERTPRGRQGAAMGSSARTATRSRGEPRGLGFPGRQLAASRAGRQDLERSAQAQRTRRGSVPPPRPPRAARAPRRRGSRGATRPRAGRDHPCPASWLARPRRRGGRPRAPPASPRRAGRGRRRRRDPP